MTRVEEIMALLNVDRRKAEFYAAIEAGETAGDCVVVGKDGREVKRPPDAE